MIQFKNILNYTSSRKLFINVFSLGLVPKKQDIIFKFKTMNTSTKPTLNEAENGNKSKPRLYDVSLLETGNYYRINGTKKKLYWDGEKWMKPQKDSRGSYDGLIAPLDKQPTNFKFAQEISISDLYE